jgi:hypothetical protein
VKLKQEATPQDSHQRRITCRQWRPTLIPVPHCQLAGFRVPHPYIECTHSYWLKSTKVTSSCAFMCNNAFPSRVDLRWQISCSKQSKRIPNSATYPLTSSTINICIKCLQFLAITLYITDQTVLLTRLLKQLVCLRNSRAKTISISSSSLLGEPG